jgi:hypothetical protein
MKERKMSELPRPEARPQAGAKQAEGILLNKASLFVLALFLCISPLWAQTDMPAAAAANNAEPLYTRQLAWNGDAYTLRYEVIVEKEESGIYRTAVQRFTTDSFIKFSLPHGKYRFRVIPYDLLNKPGRSSEWIPFEIPPATVAELPKPEEPVKEIPAIEETEEIEEVEETPLYTFIKAFDGYITLSWMPVVPVHAFDGNQFFNQSPSLAGAGARFGVVYDKLAFINLGIEFSVSWYAFNWNPAFMDNSLLHHVISMELDLIAQKWLPARTVALTFRCGVGNSQIVSGEEGGMFGEDVAISVFNANIGLSFLFMPKETFFIEIGLDYVFLFTWVYPGYFRPLAGIGWRF